MSLIKKICISAPVYFLRKEFWFVFPYFLSLLLTILQAQSGLQSWNFTCPVRILQVSDIGLVLSFEDCTQGKSFHQLCARFGAVIIIDFYIDDFIFASFIFMKERKAVNYNGSEIIGLINFKYGKRTACWDNFFTVNAVLSREAGKRSTTGYKS